MARSWDVFCRVVDNFGDAAVCWRLAAQLAQEQGGKVRLFIDALAALRTLCPEVADDLERQFVRGVEVRRWAEGADLGAPADIVVEAFGGGLPDAYVEAMVRRVPRPVWVILEYLSAEPWVAGHHRMPSPHPRLPLERHFFFPGFVPGTGGVLCEASLEARRNAFETSAGARAAFWRRFGFQQPPGGASVVSLFGYENPAAAGLLRAWAEGAQQVVVAVPQSRLRPGVCDFLGGEDPGDGRLLTRGRLEARFLPFVPQPVYDELLWACDWNFVRGEDSFVRAQWARRPLVWQIYPQAEGAHLHKLGAFLALYSAGLDAGLAAALRRLWLAWNGAEDQPQVMKEAWEELAGRPAQLRAHAHDWASRLAIPGNLAANLAHFCEERLK